MCPQEHLNDRGPLCTPRVNCTPHSKCAREDPVTIRLAGGTQALVDRAASPTSHQRMHELDSQQHPIRSSCDPGVWMQVNDAVNKGLAQHLSAAEASLAGLSSRLEAELQAATAAMEAATHATLSSATAAAAAQAPAPAAPAAPSPAATTLDPVAVRGSTRHRSGSAPSSAALAAPPPTSWHEGQGYPEQHSAQHGSLAKGSEQPIGAAGYGLSQGAGPAVQAVPPWQYAAQPAAAAQNAPAPAAPPGFAAARGPEPSAPPPPDMYGHDPHPQTMPPSQPAPWQQPPAGSPHRAPAPLQHAPAPAQGPHAPPPAPAAPAPAQPLRQGVPVYEMISNVVAALEKQEASTLADVCLATPVALVNEMSQLHAAVIMHMLCPLISRDHANIEGLLTWVRRCAERVAPMTIEQPKKVHLVFQTVLEAVETLLGGLMESTQARIAAIAVQRSIKERLPQFPE